MGLIHAPITLRNLRDASLQPLAVKALVDTGAVTLCIPEHVALQLKLEAVEQREVTLADGRKRTVPYVGPVQITSENRNSFSGALAVDDGVLLGAMALEDMALVVNPAKRKLTVDPLSPNHPSVREAPDKGRRRFGSVPRGWDYPEGSSARVCPLPSPTVRG